jgi:hypothetical protein
VAHLAVEVHFYWVGPDCLANDLSPVSVCLTLVITLYNVPSALSSFHCPLQRNQSFSHCIVLSMWSGSMALQMLLTLHSKPCRLKPVPPKSWPQKNTSAIHALVVLRSGAGVSWLTQAVNYSAVRHELIGGCRCCSRLEHPRDAAMRQQNSFSSICNRLCLASTSYASDHVACTRHVRCVQLARRGDKYARFRCTSHRLSAQQRLWRKKRRSRMQPSLA